MNAHTTGHENARRPLMRQAAFRPRMRTNARSAFGRELLWEDPQLMYCVSADIAHDLG